MHLSYVHGHEAMLAMLQLDLCVRLAVAGS